MSSVTAADLSSLLDYLAEVAAAPDLDGFAVAATIGMTQLLGGEVASYNEVDLELGTAHTYPYPAEAFTPQSGEAFAAYSHENPAIVAHLGEVEPRAYLLSDFMSLSGLRLTNLYNEVYRQVGIERQASVGLRPLPGVVLGLSVNRKGRDFSERDRVLLARAAPVLAGLHERAGLLSMLERSADESTPALVLVNQAGHAVHTTPPSRPVLVEWFGPEAAERLPAELAAWCARYRPTGEPAPLTLTSPDDPERRLTVRFLPGVGSYDVLSLTVRDPVRRRARLRQLGLSEREVDVALLLVSGLDSNDIAKRLDISPRTVLKHVERIHRKLDVHSRTELLGLCFEQFGEV